MRLLMLALIAGLCGCAAHGGPQAPLSSETQPIPSDLTSEIQSASKLGAAIFAQDQASWKATDIMLAHTHDKPDPRMKGWVTLEESTGFRVVFVGPVQDTLMAFYDVRLADQQVPRISVLDPPALADPAVALRFKAISTANHPNEPDFLLCSKTYNTIVLPASLVGKQGWLVYLLAATHEPNLVVIGGHHRFIISPDGARIVEHLALSRACLDIPKTPPGVRVGDIVAHFDHGPIDGLYATHLVTAAPVETHVFASLEHGVPIYVITSRGIWHVEGRKIDFLGQKK